MQTSTEKKMRTPWGPADQVTTVASGILTVSTPGHGGFKLDRRTNALVHEAWRTKGGWYEEDREWAIVAVTFQHNAGFSCEVVASAHQTLKDFYPDAYEAVYGVKVTAEESSAVREREALAAVKGKMLVLACWGDWATNVPKGYIGVYARIDGREGPPGAREGHYLITKEQYETGRLTVGGKKTMIHPLPADATPMPGNDPFRSK